MNTDNLGNENIDMAVGYSNGYENGYEDGKKDAVKHGHWIEDIDLLCHIRCSECDNGIDWRNAKKPNYCQHCGAKMDEKDYE